MEDHVAVDRVLAPRAAPSESKLGPRLRRLLELCPDYVLEDVAINGLKALSAYFEEVDAGYPTVVLRRCSR